MKVLLLTGVLGPLLFLAGCATTLDDVRDGKKADYIGQTVQEVAAAISKREGIEGCEVTVEDEVGRVVCW